MAILNYTTSIKSQTSVAEIQGLLAKKGARQIITHYDSSGDIIEIAFLITYNGMDIHFKLPANWRGVQKSIKSQKKSVATKYKTDTHAKNVCWRIILDWIKAQVALIEAEQADLATVFLPYAVMNNSETVASNFLQNNQGKEFLLLN